ncbi:acidic mammalian chitinase-like [Hibiscus syriacus]|uniref:Acidic mammalian chitinase-like n=1 Tax=Hibiscus syriacus TaxID=106335 RepID=A0A6A3B2L7_HIBSY|nr:acidic mammalian chitinase-like [Hibiscus syriacus]
MLRPLEGSLLFLSYDYWTVGTYALHWFYKLKKQSFKFRIATSFSAIAVIVLAADVSFSTASFPSLLTPKSISTLSTPRPKPVCTSPSRSQPLAPSPSPYPHDVIKGGYWSSWLAYSLPPSSIPTSYFIHVFYAFVGIDATSDSLSITQPDDQWMGNFTATLHAKKPPAQAMLSIGGANSGPGTFSNMVSNGNNRAAFINSTITTARKYGFDGLDFDWEFPSNPSDMSNLSILFKECRKAVESEAADSGKPPLLLSAAVFFASWFFIDTPRAYPAEAIAKYRDFVNPMCFDYHGSWDTSVTGEHALLYDKTSNISTISGISSWIDAGVPPRKLVMGDATLWKIMGTEGPKKPCDIVAYNDEHHASVVYDGDTVSEYSYSGTDWIGYDGPTSVEKKVEYAKTNDLGGYFFWALGYDMNWTLLAIGSIKYMGRNALLEAT